VSQGDAGDAVTGGGNLVLRDLTGGGQSGQGGKKGRPRREKDEGQSEHGDTKLHPPEGKGIGSTEFPLVERMVIL